MLSVPGADIALGGRWLEQTSEVGVSRFGKRRAVLEVGAFSDTSEVLTAVL